MDFDEVMITHDSPSEYDSESEAEAEEEQPEQQQNVEEMNSNDNLRELHNLHDEAVHMIEHGIQPTEGWYDERYKNIYTYSLLNWDDMTRRFKNKDTIVYEMCIKTKQYIQDILESYSGKPDFDFSVYYTILCNIINLWRYYCEKYIGAERDDDIVDIIEGMTFL